MIGLNKTNRANQDKNEGREQRWHRNENGMFRYNGKCPFNNAICKVMNHFAGSRSKV